MQYINNNNKMYLLKIVEFNPLDIELLIHITYYTYFYFYCLLCN